MKSQPTPAINSTKARANHASIDFSAIISLIRHTCICSSATHHAQPSVQPPCLPRSRRSDEGPIILRAHSLSKYCPTAFNLHWTLNKKRPYTKAGLLFNNHCLTASSVISDGLPSRIVFTFFELQAMHTDTPACIAVNPKLRLQSLHLTNGCPFAGGTNFPFPCPFRIFIASRPICRFLRSSGSHFKQTFGYIG